MLEGAQLSRAKVLYFRHNDAAHLREVLASIDEEDARILVCVEGVYSGDGDTAPLREIVAAAKERAALVLVDEAHSFLVAGPQGRGVCEAEGVLAEVDLLVLTFSKGFGGVGGALIAKRHITQYVNWYARCRMFSCALDPAAAGGVLESLRLARGEDGAARRQRATENAALLRSLLAGKVDIGRSTSWIAPHRPLGDMRRMKLVISWRSSTEIELSLVREARWIVGSRARAHIELRRAHLGSNREG